MIIHLDCESSEIYHISFNGMSAIKKNHWTNTKFGGKNQWMCHRAQCHFDRFIWSTMSFARLLILSQENSIHIQTHTQIHVSQEHLFNGKEVTCARHLNIKWREHFPTISFSSPSSSFGVCCFFLSLFPTIFRLGHVSYCRKLLVLFNASIIRTWFNVKRRFIYFFLSLALSISL